MSKIITLVLMIFLLMCGLNASEKKVLFYRNPMDPKVTSPVFMKDSMGMDYIPVYAEDETQASKKLYVSSDRQKLLGIITATVTRKLLTATLRTVGRVAGDKDLYISQQEYLSAKASKAADLIQASKQRLLWAGMSDSEIRTMDRSRTPQDGLFLPAQTAWVYLTIPEQDIGVVTPGQSVKLEFSAYPGETFVGKITGISLGLDAQTRGATARVAANNPGRRLRPEMYASATIQITLGNHLSIPASAVMRTGTQTVVFVADDKGIFSRRKVILGQKAGSDVAVISGLHNGERVVKEGHFFLDSEASLKGL